MPGRPYAAGVLCGLLAACTSQADLAPSASADPATPVVVSAVVERDYANVIEALGTGRADESVQVTSRVSGRVRTVHFAEGAAARAGDPLVTLEDEEERAELAAASASAEQAESRYRRIEELSAKGMMSKDALDEQADVLKNARARLELAKVRLDQRTIRAPFSGVLGFRQVSPGTLVTPGVAIVALDKLDTIRVDFSVPETLLTRLAPGNAVSATSAAYPGQEFSGEVSVIAARVDPATRSVSAQARIRNSRQLLKPGMLLMLKVADPPRRARFVPEGALVPENERQFVWRVDGAGQVLKVPVTTGVREAGWVEIVSGLEAGERVVAEGAINLRPGRSVRVVEPPQPG
jgi:membrane fusion protein, multidrug efflux system